MKDDNKDFNRQNENQRHKQLLKKAFDEAIRNSPGQTDLEHSELKLYLPQTGKDTVLNKQQST